MSTLTELQDALAPAVRADGYAVMQSDWLAAHERIASLESVRAAERAYRDARITALEAALDDAQFNAIKARELEVVNANIMREFAQWRDDALAEIKAQTQRMAVLECVLAAMTVERDAALKQLAAETMEPRCVEAERDALRAALCMIYDKWEDGTRCFDESENDLGNAFRLDKEEEDSILALIPKERYATTDKS